VDKSGANYAGLATMIEICQVKYLNNIIGNYSAAENYRNITLRAVMIFIKKWKKRRKNLSSFYFVFFRYTVLLAHEILESLLPIGE
jgi:hypothetical protein